MKKFLITVLFLGAAVTAARAESLTLKTYYPSPFGSYDRLRLVPRNAAAPACDASLEGLLYYESSTHSINMCSAAGTWEPITGVWTQDEDTDMVFLTNEDADEDGEPTLVGLGTDDPTHQLHLTGSGGESGRIILENLGGSASLVTRLTEPGDTTDYKIVETANRLCVRMYDKPNDNYETKIVLWENGMFGIGEGSPRTPLETKDTDENIITHRFQEANARAEIMFYNNGTFFGAFGSYGDAWADPAARRGTGITCGVRDVGFIFFRTTNPDGVTTTKALIDNDGNFGIGTEDPIAKVDLHGSLFEVARAGVTPHGGVHIAGTRPYLTFANTLATCPTNAWRMGGWDDNLLLASEEQDCANHNIDRFYMERGSGDVIMGDLDSGPQDPKAQFHVLSQDTGSDAFRVDDELNDPTPFIIDENGNVGIGVPVPTAKLDVDGSILQRGAVLYADYVFDDDYVLESIEEHAEFMWENKHLAAIPKAEVDAQGQAFIEYGETNKGLVEELEKAHIYIEQLHNRLNELENKLDDLSL